MVNVVPFEEKYQHHVVELILKIQREEYGLAITAEDQPDLMSVEEYYRRGQGNFWVAVSRGCVVGTVSLLDIGNGHGALRKMFVRSDFRGSRYGTAALLLDKLMDWAGETGFSRIFLGTTSRFLAAHRFYEKNGFSLIPKEQLPVEFPVMTVDSRFYVRNLSATRGS